MTVVRQATCAAGRTLLLVTHAEEEAVFLPTASFAYRDRRVAVSRHKGKAKTQNEFLPSRCDNVCPFG